MRPLSRFGHVLVVSIAVGSSILPGPAGSSPGPGPEEGPGRAAIEQAQARRRSALYEWERYTEGLRREIIEGSKDVVADQDRAVEKAKRESDAAIMAREAAEYAAREYDFAIYPQDLLTAENEVELARADLERANDSLQAALDDEDRGRKNPHRLLRCKLDVDSATFSKEGVETRLQVLAAYEHGKQRGRLAALVQQAKTDEAAKAQLLKAEEQRRVKIARRSSRLGARSAEDYVIALINESVRCEEQALTLIAEAKALEGRIAEKPDDGAALIAELREKRDRARDLMAQAGEELAEAATLGEQARLRRVALAEAETRLKRERAKVELAERQIPVPK